MARDYTKYNVEGLGENLNKRKLVFTIVKDWVSKNNPTFEELQNAFPDEVQGGKGFIRKESEVTDPKRFNMREPLKIKNGAHVVVSNQWGDNIEDFIVKSEKLGYKIFKADIFVAERDALTESSGDAASLDNVEIEISGRIPNFFFGAVREEYLEELQTALDCSSDDIEEIGDVIQALFHTTLDNSFEDHLETFKSNFDMDIISDKCPNIMEIIQMVENDEMGHYRFYEWFLDDPRHDINVIEDDAFITITVNNEVIVDREELKDFLIDSEFPDYDNDSKTKTIVKDFLDANKESYGLDYDDLEDDISIGVSKNGVKQISHWMEHENFKDFKTRENNVTVCHDNISILYYNFDTENFDLAKLIFLGYSNMADFHNSAPEYVGSYLAYGSEVIEPEVEVERDKGIELEYEPRFQSLLFLIEG